MSLALAVEIRTPTIKKLQSVPLREGDRIENWTFCDALLEATALSNIWNVPRQEIERLQKSQQIFSVHCRNRTWYPYEYVHFKVQEIIQLTAHMSFLDDCSKIVFLMRHHSKLGKLTPGEAAKQGYFQQILDFLPLWPNQEVNQNKNKSHLIVKCHSV